MTSAVLAKAAASLKAIAQLGACKCHTKLWVGHAGCWVRSMHVVCWGVAEPYLVFASQGLHILASACSIKVHCVQSVGVSSPELPARGVVNPGQKLGMLCHPILERGGVLLQVWLTPEATQCYTDCLPLVMSQVSHQLSCFPTRLAVSTSQGCKCDQARHSALMLSLQGTTVSQGQLTELLVHLVKGDRCEAPC